MTRQNPLQHISSELAKELKQSREKATRSKVVPFGMEQVDARTALSRLQTMTRADLEAMDRPQYQQLVESVGTDAIMDVIRREQQPQTGGGFL